MGLKLSIREKFREAFEQQCFQLLIEAYNTSLIVKSIKLNWNENDISSELQEYITKNPLRLKWKISANVESHIPKDIPKVKGFSSKFPRIDFRLTSFKSTYEYDYFFEAKNLKQNDSALKRRYIDTGINNFVSEKYQNGSVIGYLLEGDIQETINGINLLLNRDKRSTETLELKPYTIFEAYYESYHSEIGIMKHLIFNFTSLL